MASLRAFLSHSHMDISWCDGFVAELEQHGLDVWYDRKSIYVGAQWIKKIEQEIQGRDYFLIAWTPDSKASQWVQSELSLALREHKQIIGILCKPTTVEGFLSIYQLLDATQLDAKQAAQMVLAALKGTKPPFSPPPVKPHSPQSKAPSNESVRGEWASEGDEQPGQKVELLLNQYREPGNIRDGVRVYNTKIKGTGDHWLCGKVTIEGTAADSGIDLTLTPVQQNGSPPAGGISVTRIELQLTLLPSGKMKGNEVVHGYQRQKGFAGWLDWFSTQNPTVVGTRTITFSPTGN
jgi:hypothetical protein